MWSRLSHQKLPVPSHATADQTYRANTNAKADPSIMNSSPMKPASRVVEAPDCRAAEPDEDAAALPVTPAASPLPAVMGALTTRTEVEVSTWPLGRVV